MKIKTIMIVSILVSMLWLSSNAAGAAPGKCDCYTIEYGWWDLSGSDCWCSIEGITFGNENNAPRTCCADFDYLQGLHWIDTPTYTECGTAWLKKDLIMCWEIHDCH